MRLNQAAVGTVLQRRNAHGALHIVRVTAGHAGGESFYLPYGVKLEGGASYLDVERRDDWEPTPMCEACGQPVRLHTCNVGRLSELGYGSRLALVRDRSARVKAGCDR